MTITADHLNRKFKYDSYQNHHSDGRYMALCHVGWLFADKMTEEEFDHSVLHISSAPDNIPAARKAFNEGFLEMLETLMAV